VESGAVKVYIDYAYCISCGLCREVCPDVAITHKYIETRHLYEVHAEKCTGCGECLEYCPVPGALVQYQPTAAPTAAAR
jgi:formate hydrogenlyase subunit 6/NADH:ubiquinone oxidoreductase subunit I